MNCVKVGMMNPTSRMSVRASDVIAAPIRRNGARVLTSFFATALILLMLTACSKTVSWEEEVALNSGETMWVKRTLRYTKQGGAGNPFDIAYRPEWNQRIQFTWNGKPYAYEGSAQIFLLAISPQKLPVLVADPDDGIWRGEQNFLSCARPTYVELIPSEGGDNWSWPPAIEPWLYGLPANLMRQRGKPEKMKERYTVSDRDQEDATARIQNPAKARIDPMYVSNGFCYGKATK